MIKQGIPMPYVRWLYSFLLNRQARVKLNGVESKSRYMRQGLPQGSVLSPILFLFYINNLANILPSDIVAALFADDVSILSTSSNKEEARKTAQKAVDVVTRWAKDWKSTLNAGKSEVGFFSTWVGEARWKPKISVSGKMIKFNPNPRLLGVILDRM